MGLQRYYFKKPIIIVAEQIDKSFEVETLEGIMKGKAGDYLVTGVRGEQYPVNKEIFEETYEEARIPAHAPKYKD